MRRGLAAAALCAVAVLFLTPFSAPAGAQAAPPTVTDGTVSVAMSSGNTNPPLLSGHFHVNDSGATVTVDAAESARKPLTDLKNPPVFTNPQHVCPSPQCTPDGNGNVTIAGFPLQPATPAYNGPYHVDVTATARNVFGSSNPKVVPLDFAIAVAPPNVTGVTATVDSKTRQVTVSWNRDSTTPDAQSYWIYRKGPGEADFHPRLQTQQQPTGARISITDPATANTGGDYLYEIEAHRNGVSGDGSTFVPSDRTAKESLSNKVTVPNPPPGATTIPQPPPSSNGSPPVVRGTPSGVNRNSGFSSSGSSATTPTSEAVTPDPGFQRGLPDVGATPGADNSEGDNSAVAQTPGRHTSSGKGYLVPVAGGAVLFLGALHLRLLKKRLDEPPSNLTPVA